MQGMCPLGVVAPWAGARVESACGHACPVRRRRPRLREAEARCAALTSELAAAEGQLAAGLRDLKACRQREADVRRLCERHGEPLPLGLLPDL